MDSNILIISLGVFVGCLIGLSWFAGSDAPYVPTKTVRVKKALKEAGLKKGLVFWELGCGDGRVVLEAARMGAWAYGVEQSWLRVLWGRYQAKKQRLPNAKFIHGDIFNLSFWKDNIKDADIVFIFLLPQGVKKLEPLLKKHLKKGSRVITQTFHFPNWKPYKKVLVKDSEVPNSPLGKGVFEGDFWYYRK